MTLRFLDFETRDTNAQLTRVGASKYTKQRDFTLLCMSWADDNNEPELWVPGDPFPDWVYTCDPNVTYVAHNAPFEMAVVTNHCVEKLGWAHIPVGQWVCTAARCRAMGLPGALGDAALALGLDFLKDKEGHRLMLKYTKARKPTKSNPDQFHDNPAELARVQAYNVTDVLVEREIFKHTKRLSVHEKALWNLDQLINNAGFQVDVETCQQIVGVLKVLSDRLLKKLCDITGGYIKSNSPVKYKEYLLEHHDIEIENVQAATIKELLADPDIQGTARDVLQIRQQLALASVKKFQGFVDRAEDDGRIRGTHLYHGASTGRWASRGVQTQNMKRGWKDDKQIELCVQTCKKPDAVDRLEFLYGDAMDAMSNITRAMIVAPKGKWLGVMDFASIEARVSAWLADETTMLEQFRNNEDVYVAMAARVFDTPVDSVDGYQRFIGKQIILGLSYGLGAKMFRINTNELAEKLGMPIELDEKFSQDAVDLYRTTYSRIKAYWYELEHAAISAVVNRPIQAMHAGKVQFALEKYKGNVWLVCRLPSGRCIHYAEPRVGDALTPWGDMEPQLTYLTNIQGSASSRGAKIIRRPDEEHIWHKNSSRYTSKWQRISIYGGHWLENVTQGASRDFQAESMQRAFKDRFRTVLHCHDEVAVEMSSKTDLERVKQTMLIRPDWAQDCPIDAAGFACKRYRKD